MKMRLPIWIVAIVFLAAILLAVDQKKSPPEKFWKGELIVLSFGVESFADYKSWQDMSTSQVYQNPAGVVRHELTNMRPAPSVVSGIDFQIIDYRSGTYMGFDKGKPTAIRSKMSELERNPLRPQSGVLGAMKIMGYQCKGIQNKLQDLRNNQIEVRETWITTEVSFKDPLLEISKRAGMDGKPISMTIKFITSLETVDWLEPSLFAIPVGTHFTDVHH